MVAGRDIVAVNLYAQNLHDTDISLVEAGRDIRHINTAVYTNALYSNVIKVGGAGELQVIAGRDVDLGNGAGIIAIGNDDNNALPDTGADVLVMAGARSADYQAFADRYFTAV